MMTRDKRIFISIINQHFRDDKTFSKTPVGSAFIGITNKDITTYDDVKFQEEPIENTETDIELRLIKENDMFSILSKEFVIVDVMSSLIPCIKFVE